MDENTALLMIEEEDGTQYTASLTELEFEAVSDFLEGLGIYLSIKL